MVEAKTTPPILTEEQFKNLSDNFVAAIQTFQRGDQPGIITQFIIYLQDNSQDFSGAFHNTREQLRNYNRSAIHAAEFRRFYNHLVNSDDTVGPEIYPKLINEFIADNADISLEHVVTHAWWQLIQNLNQNENNQTPVLVGQLALVCNMLPEPQNPTNI